MNEPQLGPTAQQVLSFMQRHPREYFTADELAEYLDCTPMQLGVALETLSGHQLLEKAQTTSGKQEYVYLP